VQFICGIGVTQSDGHGTSVGIASTVGQKQTFRSPASTVVMSHGFGFASAVAVWAISVCRTWTADGGCVGVGVSVTITTTCSVGGISGLGVAVGLDWTAVVRDGLASEDLFTGAVGGKALVGVGISCMSK